MHFRSNNPLRLYVIWSGEQNELQFCADKMWFHICCVLYFHYYSLAWVTHSLNEIQSYKAWTETQMVFETNISGLRKSKQQDFYFYQKPVTGSC